MSGATFELVALRGFSLPAVTGALNFAPGRWLLPEATHERLSALKPSLDSGEAALVDVTGKWVRLVLNGPTALPVLRRAIAVDIVMEGRDCAALRLFDCPAVLARATGGFDIWVEASYAVALRASLATALTHCTAA